MKKIVTGMALALCLAAASPSLAQQPQPAQPVYYVQKGDTAYELAGKNFGDAELWKQIVKANSFLQQPGRVFDRDGKTIVLLRPGEHLVGLEKLGIVPKRESIDSLVRNSNHSPQWYESGIAQGFGLALLLVLLAAAIAAYLIDRMLNRPAATSGAPMIRGGATPLQARERFDTMARQQRFDIVGPVTSGRIWGVLNVHYSDRGPVPRRLNGERAYRATIRREDSDVTEEIYMLQACGNDLQYGGVSRYLPGPDFRFEADADQVATPVPAAAEAVEDIPPVTPVPALAETPVVSHIPEPQPEAKESGGDGTVTFEYKPARGEQPTLIRLTGTTVEEMTCTMGPDGFTVRYRSNSEEPANEEPTVPAVQAA